MTNDKVKLTSDLIFGFTGSLLSGGFDEPAPTPECHREWWDLCTSGYKRVAIAAPRGHAKSTAITKSYTLAALLFRDRQYAVIVSDTYKQSVMFLAEIKRELQANEDLIKLFGIKGFLTDREDDIVVEMNDGHLFRVMSVGSEQKIRGFLWNGKRPDLIVGDDMENDELVMNPDRREKFSNWFMRALLPILSEKGVIRIVGTILHLDSLLEGFMPKERDSNTINTAIKSWTIKPKNSWMGVKYLAHDEGEPLKAKQFLWPIKWTPERLNDVYQMFIGKGNPEGYWQEYLNKPIDPTNAFFRKTDFLEYEEGDSTRPFTHYPTYCSVDLAVSTKQKRDYCALIVSSVDEQGVMYVRHVHRERMDSRDIVDTIIRLADVWKFNTLLIGKGALSGSIGPFLREKLYRMGKFIHLEELPEIIDKRSRAQPMRARMRAGGVKFDKRKAWFPEFEAELLQFDRGLHDDQVDAMSLLGMFLDNIIDAPTPKEIDDEEWENELATNRLFEFGSGRSSVTGY